MATGQFTNRTDTGQGQAEAGRTPHRRTPSYTLIAQGIEAAKGRRGIVVGFKRQQISLPWVQLP